VKLLRSVGLNQRPYAGRAPTHADSLIRSNPPLLFDMLAWPVCSAAPPIPHPTCAGSEKRREASVSFPLEERDGLVLFGLVWFDLVSFRTCAAPIAFHLTIIHPHATAMAAPPLVYKTTSPDRLPPHNPSPHHSDRGSSASHRLTARNSRPFPPLSQANLTQRVCCILHARAQS
jgi:hypothetical protein